MLINRLASLQALRGVMLLLGVSPICSGFSFRVFPCCTAWERILVVFLIAKLQSARNRLPQIGC